MLLTKSEQRRLSTICDGLRWDAVDLAHAVCGYNGDVDTWVVGIRQGCASLDRLVVSKEEEGGG